MPVLLMPMHVVLLELIVDPVCSLVFEAEPGAADAMDQPPRNAGEGLFGKREMMLAAFEGLGILGVSFALAWAARDAGLPEQQIRATAFISLVFGNLVLAFASSANAGTAFFDSNRMNYWIIAALAVAAMGLALFWPAASQVFHVEPAPPIWLGLAATGALVAGGWSGLARKLRIL